MRPSLVVDLLMHLEQHLLASWKLVLHGLGPLSQTERVVGGLGKRHPTPGRGVQDQAVVVTDAESGSPQSTANHPPLHLGQNLAIGARISLLDDLAGVDVKESVR